MSAPVQLEQGSHAWHRHRAVHANASEAATVMGVSPWEPDTWFKLWQLKTGRMVRPGLTPYQRRGAEMEARARAAYERLTGNIMQPMVVSKGGWLSASLDGISFNGDLILEIKCPSGGEASYTWRQAQSGSIPEHYYWQLQHQLHVSAAPVSHFWVFDGDKGLLIERSSNADDQHRLVHTWRDFWMHIETDTPPELSAKDTLTREDTQWAAAARAYKLAKEDLRLAQASAEAARKALIGLTDHPRVTGAGVTVTRYWQDGHVNYAAVPELKGVQLDQYRAPKSQQVKITTAT
jgi:putative phage-type endonuclease